MTPEKDNIILVVANLDPFQAHESVIHLPLGEIGVSPQEKYVVDELITGNTYLWTGEMQQVFLEPQVEPAMILRINRWAYKDYDTPCF